MNKRIRKKIQKEIDARPLCLGDMLRNFWNDILILADKQAQDEGYTYILEIDGKKLAQVVAASAERTQRLQSPD